MSQENLPPAVIAAGIRLQDPQVGGDPQSRALLIAFGYEQIDREYPLDPLRAPLNVIRRQQARAEWDAAIRTGGKQLRAVLAGAAAVQAQFALDQKLEDARARVAEERRQAAAKADAERQLDTYEKTSKIDEDKTVRIMQEEARLKAEEEAAAAKRRLEEMDRQAEHDIGRLIVEAITAAMGTSSAADILEVNTLIQDRIRSIRRDTELTDDEKHIAIKSLLDSVPLMLSAAQRREGPHR